MIEKEYALKLKEKVQEELIKDKSNYFCEYAIQNKELAQCDYRTLQAECEKLGFHIYNFKESPVYQKILSKGKWTKYSILIFFP